MAPAARCPSFLRRKARGGPIIGPFPVKPKPPRGLSAGELPTGPPAAANPHARDPLSFQPRRFSAAGADARPSDFISAKRGPRDCPPEFLAATMRGKKPPDARRMRLGPLSPDFIRDFKAPARALCGRGENNCGRGESTSAAREKFRKFGRGVYGARETYQIRGRKPSR